MNCSAHRTPRGATAALLLAALVLTLFAPRASAQIVHGTVRDAHTKEPLEGAVVALVTLADSVVATSQSIATGEFRLRALEPGRYRLRLRRLGFKEAVSDPILVRASETVLVDLALAPAESRLTPVVVTERRRITPGSEVFARRKALGQGIFLTDADIEAMKARSFAEVLMNVDGLRMVPISTRAARRGFPVSEHEAIVSTEGHRCMYLLLNGHRLRVLTDEEGSNMLENMLSRRDIAGIEVFRSFKEVPEELRMLAWPPPVEQNMRTSTGRTTFNRIGTTDPCGIVFLWTKAAW